NPTAGKRIFSVKGTVQALVGAGAGLLEVMDTTGPGVYTLVGNDACAPRPNAPTSLTAANTSHSVATLNWKDNSDNETNFLIERSTTVDSNFVQIASVNAGVTSYADSTVVRKVTYYYRVRASNGTFNSLYSNVASVNVKK
ncbi:MAG TPA: fibronectin type III domain-containing protein, partial [Pyrinomonadaceae bacterium]|nr:fibronectin type III domain-containing protein [Pyrinomonadaceae bacterium]